MVQGLMIHTRASLLFVLASSLLPTTASPSPATSVTVKFSAPTIVDDFTPPPHNGGLVTPPPPPNHFVGQNSPILAGHRLRAPAAQTMPSSIGSVRSFTIQFAC
jgi:hypothetical protein